MSSSRPTEGYAVHVKDIEGFTVFDTLAAAKEYCRKFHNKYGTIKFITYSTIGDIH